MPALSDCLGWIDVEAVRAFGSSRSRQNPWDVTRSLGWDRAVKSVQPCSLPRCVSCFTHADPSFPCRRVGHFLLGFSRKTQINFQPLLSLFCLPADSLPFKILKAIKYSQNKNRKMTPKPKNPLGLCILLNKSWNLCTFT